MPTVVAFVALAAAIAAVELGWRDPSPGLGVDVPVPRLAEPLVERLRSVPLSGIGDARAAAVASGVVFGRTEHVTAADEAAFLDSGLWHLLAASGQNVALVAGCCILLARGLGAGRTTGSVLALLAIPAYVLVVGGGASIVRAGIMGELAVIAWLAGRLADVRHVLLVVAAVICWTWPGAHRGLGMQLSFACVAALAWWAMPATRWLVARGVPHWLASALAATLLCSAVTAPILVLRAGSAPLTGIVANVIAVPIAGCVLVIGLAGAVLTVVADGLGVPELGRPLLAPTGWLARLLLDLAHRAAGLPGAQTSSRLLAIGVPLLGGAGLALLPVRWVRRRRAALLLAGCCIVLAALPALARHTPARALVREAGGAPALEPGSLRIGVLDIGQGDATLLVAGDAAILVDAGPPGGRVVERVRELGVDRVDGIVLTHDSLDHRGGVESAVAALDPAWIAIPRLAPGPWERIRVLAPRIVEVCAGSSFAVGSARIDVRNPRCDGTIVPRTGDIHNDGAMVLLVRHGAIRALLPADAEAPVLVDLGLPALDLLRVAHHGSADPALPALLQRTRPEVAAISAGEGNGYGHPTGQALAALRAEGVRVLRTDEDGSVVFDSDGLALTLVG